MRSTTRATRRTRRRVQLVGSDQGPAASKQAVCSCLAVGGSNTRLHTYIDDAAVEASAAASLLRVLLDSSCCRGGRVSCFHWAGGHVLSCACGLSVSSDISIHLSGCRLSLGRRGRLGLGRGCNHDARGSTLQRGREGSARVGDKGIHHLALRQPLSTGACEHVIPTPRAPQCTSASRPP